MVNGWPAPAGAEVRALGVGVGVGVSVERKKRPPITTRARTIAATIVTMVEPDAFGGANESMFTGAGGGCPKEALGSRPGEAFG